MKLGSKTYERWFKSAAGGRVLEEISDADRNWFTQNPTRKFRFRDSVFSEMDTPAAPNMVWKTLVVQVKPGFRFITSVEIDFSESNFDPNDDRHLLLLATKIFPKTFLDVLIKEYQST
jgi:hypothetical protein